ncbi:MAG: hypothetical protein WD898_01020 [Candidatus Paceibacterota bacterium]
MSNKKILTILAIVVVAVILIWVKTGSKDKSLMLDPKTSNGQSGNQTVDDNQPVNTLEGTLRVSDDPSKGNLMLVTEESVVYITTSRDYSSLVGEEVVVSVDGTLENFTLLNINKSL